MPAVSQIRAGDLRHRIVIMRPVESVDSYGGAQKIEWTPFMKVFASIDTAGGSEDELSGQVQAQQRVRFRMRYFPGLLAKYRIWHRSEYYDIQTVINYGGRDAFLDVVAVKSNG